MKPTHKHADGGLYRLYATGIGGKDEGEWVDGVLYQGVEDGKIRWTSKRRFDERFEVIEYEVVEAKSFNVAQPGEDGWSVDFIFRLDEANDLRHLFVTAAPQRGHRVSPEWLDWTQRVLNEMAYSVMQGLHLRDHDFPDLLGDVNAFHAKFGQEYVGKPRRLPNDLFDFRVGFHKEETTEYEDEQELLKDAIVRGDRRDILHHLEQQLDALVDSAWVILGTADLQFGRKAFFEAWKRVVIANMAKVKKQVDGEDDGTQDSGRAPKYDIVKPKGWTPPDHRDLIEDNAILDELEAD